MTNIKFSTRFAWQTGINALGQLVAEKKRQGRIIYDLTESNPTRVGLVYPVQSILAALSGTAAMVYTPDPRGWAPARAAIAGYYQGLGQGVDPDHLFLTAHTSEAYSMIFKLLTDPGDEILVPHPGYPLLNYLAGFENLKTVAYPLRSSPQTGWSLDLDVLDALVTHRTRAIVVVNPNNPTGSYLTRTEFAALDAICGRHGLALIVDEVFFDFQAEEAHSPATSALNQTSCLTFVLNGLSKMLALPQVKLGWIALGGDPALVHRAGQGLEILLDFFLSVGTPVQHALERLLSHRHQIQTAIMNRVESNACFLTDQAVVAPHCRVLPRQGGWFVVLDVTDTDSDDRRVLRLLQQADTLVHPGFFYDFGREGYVVVSLLPQSDLFQAGVYRMLECWC